MAMDDETCLGRLEKASDDLTQALIDTEKAFRTALEGCDLIDARTRAMRAEIRAGLEHLADCREVARVLRA